MKKWTFNWDFFSFNSYKLKRLDNHVKADDELVNRNDWNELDERFTRIKEFCIMQMKIESYLNLNKSFHIAKNIAISNLVMILRRKYLKTWNALQDTLGGHKALYYQWCIEGGERLFLVYDTENKIIYPLILDTKHSIHPIEGFTRAIDKKNKSWDVNEHSKTIIEKIGE